jgi:heme-degrading monooxygenase HmoA
MFARVSTYHGKPESVNRGIQASKEMREVEQMQGFVRAYLLVDRKTGKAMTMTLWESEEAVRATSDSSNPLRDRISQAFGASGPASVEVYEVGDVTEAVRKAA